MPLAIRLMPPEIICDEFGRIKTVDGIEPPHITDVLREMGLSKSFEGVDPWYAERGKAVHSACKLINEGVLDENSITEEIGGYVEAYRTWLKESGFSHEMSEIPLYSGLHEFCGTIDLVGVLPPHGRVVIDIKTSSSLDPAVELQVGADSILWNHNYQDRPIAKRFVLQLKKDGTYRLKDLSQVNEFLFLDALKLWRWKQSHKRKVKPFFSMEDVTLVTGSGA